MKRWLIKKHDPDAAATLVTALGVAPLTARVLASRGYLTPEAAGTFLNPRLSQLPNPSLIAGMDQAAARVAKAVREGEKIWLYTDFDVDGVTSAALLAEFFTQLDATWEAYLPRRDREGYGLHAEPLREIAARGGGLVVTADCGITALEPARVARELGLGLVITDHHTPLEELPEADAVVNPKLPGSTYPDEMIAGVGVAFNLAAAVRGRLRDEGWFEGREMPDAKALLDFAALGTVADVVPLRGVNRILVAAGLERMNRNPRPGFTALAQVAGLKGELGAGQLGFQLGPRINAAGRMAGPLEALNLLLSKTLEEARQPAALLDKLNSARRDEEAQTLKAAIADVEGRALIPGNYTLVIKGEGYHQGVIGIVASRLAERYCRPAVVLSVNDGVARGSGRSIRGFNLYDALSACGDIFTRFGGHAAAAGLTIEEGRIGEFIRRFEEIARETLTPEDLSPLIEADGEATPDELTPAVAQELKTLGPFGFGNPTPVLLARNLKVRKRNTMGPIGQHLKLELDFGYGAIEAVGWSLGQGLTFAQPGATIDLVGALTTSTWRNSVNLQFTITDARLAR